MYTVHMMRLNATEARQEFFRLLDAVEQGESVIVERKGVRFQLALVPAASASAPTSPVAVCDPEVLSGEWTWKSDEDGNLQFRGR